MPPIRKYESGHSKELKRRKAAKLVNSLRGSLNKFFTREPANSGENVDDNGSVGGDNDNENENDAGENVNDAVENVNEGEIVNDAGENENGGENVNDANVPPIDIYDPRNWDSLDKSLIDLLVENGPPRDLSIVNGPPDRFNRHFSSKHYTRFIGDGEKYDREWLVYSKELDKVFCFCCKLFKRGPMKGTLPNDGFNDWRHIGRRLKDHENSSDHLVNASTWIELRLRLQKRETIDKAFQEQIMKEKEHWRSVLKRIIAIVKFLAKYNLAFRGTKERLYEPDNGLFLGCCEMMAECEEVMQEHCRRIVNSEIHIHYLGHRIQNELVHMMALEIKTGIIKKVKAAEYFSVILDCTPDVSHQEQMSLILRCVNVSKSPIQIEEFFVEFLNVHDTSGKGLFEELQAILQALDLDMKNVRGQGYDNGSNMKGKHQGVQKRMLEINPRALYTPCGCHCLNLSLCDVASCTERARDFFGSLQHIYTLFAGTNIIIYAYMFL